MTNTAKRTPASQAGVLFCCENESLTLINIFNEFIFYRKDDGFYAVEIYSDE